MTKFGLFPLLLVVTFSLNACGVLSTPAPTETPAPTATPTVIPSPTQEITVGTDIKVELPEGDLERGEYQALINRCIECHVNGIATRFESDTDLPKISERGEIRMADPAYNGNATTNEEYILESILIPDIYIVPGTPEKAIMPTHLGKLLTKQDLADLLVWLSTFE